MSEKEATAIMTLNRIDQEEMEDEEKKHGVLPESIPPDDIDLNGSLVGSIDINGSIAGSLVSSLQEGSTSVLGMGGAASVAMEAAVAAAPETLFQQEQNQGYQSGRRSRSRSRNRSHARSSITR